MVGAEIVLFLTVVYILFRPNGAIGSQISQWRENREVRRVLAAEWPLLTDTDGQWGAREGRIVAVEFSDYECPYCRLAHVELKGLLARAPYRVVYRHFPLPSHPAARGAARAAICAGTQGRFSEMHDRLFETTDWQRDTNWTREAVGAGVRDIEEFHRCLGRPGTMARLAQDEALARKLGVTGTPTFFTPSGKEQGVLPEIKLRSFFGLN